MEFSPDSNHLAVGGRDGKLYLLNTAEQHLVAIFESYFGAFLCVSWSPDGQYLITGGEDDLVGTKLLQISTEVSGD